MSRRRRVRHKIEVKDPRYDSVLVAKFVNTVMGAGKKSLAERIVYAAIERANEGSDNVDPLEILTRSVENSKPRLEVKSRRVGGATYQVPVEVKENRRIALSVRWVIQNAKARSGRSMAEKLTGEIVDAYNNAGGSIKKKDEVHRMAEANKAFAHYRW